MIAFHVEGMTCGGCAKAIAAAIKTLDDQAVVEVDLPSKTVRVDSTRPTNDVREAIAEAGFEVI
jgi:copper chaperone